MDITMNQSIRYIKQAFERNNNCAYEMYSAPGRINIIGEHTDYNEGFVLPAAIDKRIYLAIAARNDTVVEIISTDYDEKVTFDIEDDRPFLPHWAVYPFGVVKELHAAGGILKGFNAVFGGDIPKGAGMSSSAAIESAFACAINSIFSLEMDKLSLAKIGQKAEHNFAGVRCGIMDQFASFFGKKDHVIRLDCRTLEHDFFPLALKGYELVLADTRVKHSLAASEYNTRRQQCEEGVRIIRKRHTHVHSLRDVSKQIMHQHQKALNKDVFNRCNFVVNENARVLQSCAALEAGDFQKLGKLMYESHEGLRHDYEVSCEELNILVDTAKKIQGVAGARMMGGGFGGCTLNLIQKKDVETFNRQCSKAFYAAFGKQPFFYSVKTDNGAGQM